MSSKFLLDKYLENEAVFEIESNTRDDVLKEICTKALNLGAVKNENDAVVLFNKLLQREELGSTGIIPFIAIPHCKVDCIDEDMLIFVGYSKKGFDFNSQDKNKVHVLFCILTKKNLPTLHLGALAAISKMISKYSISKNYQLFTDRSVLEKTIREFEYEI